MSLLIAFMFSIRKMRGNQHHEYVDSLSFLSFYYKREIRDQNNDKTLSLFMCLYIPY